MKLGEQKTISVTFPEDYAAANFAGKPASFDVTLKACASPADPAVDDAFAQSLGFPDLAKMREAVQASLEGEQAAISRRKWKRELLDALDKKFRFELPPALVSREFEKIWQEATAERTRKARAPPTKEPPRGGAGGFPEDCRTPGATGPRPGRGRRKGGRDRQRRRSRAGARSTGAQFSRNGTRARRLLPEESGAAGRDPRATIRGKGRRPSPH